MEAVFDTYIPKLQRLIEEEFRNWRPDFKIKDFKQEFRSEFMVIPIFDAKPLHWELLFSTIHDQNHDFTIDFIDEEPQGVFIDG